MFCCYTPPLLTASQCPTRSPVAVPLPTLYHVVCLPMLSCSSLVYVCGLGFCPFSGLVCDLLLTCGRGLSPSWTLPEESLGHNLSEHDEQCSEDTRVVWCGTYRSGGLSLSLSLYRSGGLSLSLSLSLYRSGGPPFDRALLSLVVS